VLLPAGILVFQFLSCSFCRLLTLQTSFVGFHLFADNIHKQDSARAIAFLDNKLIVLSSCDSRLHVYDATNSYASCGSINVPVLKFVDMVVCHFNHCIYMVDAGRSEGRQPSSSVIRFKLGSHYKKTMDGNIDSSTVISVMRSHDLLVVCSSANALKIFDAHLIPLKCVPLQSDIVSLTCAVELTPGRYVLTHGKDTDALHRVCVVNSEGKLLHTYGCLKGSYPGLLDSPEDVFVDKNGFVYVDNGSTKCLIVLSPTLEFIHRISAPLGTNLNLNNGRPQLRFSMDKESGYLYVRPKYLIEYDSSPRPVYTYHL